jgi:ABC-type microcin C transport system permease subunit YejB
MRFCFSVTLVLFLFFLFVLVPCLGVTNVAKMCRGFDVFSTRIVVTDYIAMYIQKCVL